MHVPPKSPELSIVMPCLNEAETLEACIIKAKAFMDRYGILGEIIIADNGSADDSRDIASRNGAIVINAKPRGYGAAVMAGIKHATGDYIIMGDCDGSYDFSNLMPMLKALRDGCDLVVGNRFKGGIALGAMPFLHQYIGNPILSFIGNCFFKSPCKDFHCGLRGFKRQSIMALHLVTTGMEFASEMIVKATLKKLTISEVPVFLSQDGRNKPSHMRSWRDGWRHLRFLLLYSPRWLFLYPGVLMLGIGLVIMFLLLPAPIRIGGVGIDVHTLLISGMLANIGVQTILFGLLASQFAYSRGLLPSTPQLYELLRNISLERLLLVALLIIILGATGITIAIVQWGETNFGQLNYEKTMRYIIPSSTLVIAGVQIIFFAFFSSLLNLGLEDNPSTFL